jgi:hypothetical protein
MRNDAIYIRTRSHVIRMCPRTGIFDVVPSRVIYRDRQEYRENYGYDLFERLFKEQFAMSGCTDEILDMFYTVLGLWLNPKSEKTNVVIVGKKSLATYYLTKIMAAVTGTCSRHDLFLYESENDFKYQNRYKKIDFAFRTCPIPSETFDDKWRTVIENERELENIQFRAIQALSAYFKNGGFKQPEYCLTALKNLTTDDHMDRYVSEQFVICSDSDVNTEANKAHQNYLEWHFANEIRQPYLVKRRFYATLRAMGFRLERSNNVYRILGVLLKNQRTNQSLTSFKENGLIT